MKRKTVAQLLVFMIGGFSIKEPEVFLFLSLIISWGSIPLGIKLGDFFVV